MSAFGLKCPPDDICSRSLHILYNLDFNCYFLHICDFFKKNCCKVSSMPSLCHKTWKKCSFLCPSVAKNTGSTDSIGSKTWNTVITPVLQRSLKQLKRQKQRLDEPNNSHQKLRDGSMVSWGNKMNWHRKDRGEKITPAMEHKESRPSHLPFSSSYPACYQQEDPPPPFWASSSKGSFQFWGHAQTAAPPKT